MKLWLKFVINFQLFCILFIQINECYNKNKKDICDVSKFEDNIHYMFTSFVDKKYKWPSNENEMDHWCKAVLTSHKYVKRFADKCLRGLSRMYTAIVAHNTGKINKYFCKNKQARKRLINKSACATKGKDRALKCWNKMITTIEIIKDVKIQKEKLPLLCCTLYFYNDCTIDVYEKLHPRYCTVGNLEHMQVHLQGTTIDAFSIICSEYIDQSKCINYKDKINRYGKTDVPLRHRTGLPGMWEILKTL